MKEKIAHLMKSESLSSSRLAEILEIQPSAVSHLLSGRNKPGFDLLQKILRRFPKINPDWLLLDSEQIYRVDDKTPLPYSDEVGEGSPIDLFGGDGVLLSGFGATQLDSIEGRGGDESRDFRARNLGDISPRNIHQNSASNLHQNSSNISPQNSPQNPTQNRGGIAANFAQKSVGCSVAVERIIVLYSDGTCRTYEMR